MSDRDLVEIGRVAKVHGLKGELSVDWYADSPLLLDRLPALLLRLHDTPPRRFTVRGWRRHHGRVLLWLNDLGDRDRAQEWRGASILARRAELPPPGEEEVYLADLEGLDVYLDDGAKLGIINAIMLEPQEVWTIVTPRGEVLFPVQPQFVTEIDLDAGRVVISPPPGLLELYLG